MNKLIAAERQNEILQMVNQQGSVKLGPLAEAFGVSKETIRKDLLHLDAIGQLKKSHGGAISLQTNNSLVSTISVEDRHDINTPIKMKLAKRAMELVDRQGVIFLDTGTTIQYIAELLKDTTTHTVITPSLNSALAMSGTTNTVHLIGGQINYTTMSVEGNQAAAMLNNLKVDIAFLGSNGFDQHTGPASSNLNDSAMKEIVLKNARMTVVVVDSSKASFTSLSQYAKWSEIDYVISDQDLPEQYQTLIGEVSNLILV